MIHTKSGRGSRVFRWATARARKVGADVRAAACIIELAFLNGRGKLSVPFVSVVSYDS